jgi:hypothetical protein
MTPLVYRLLIPVSTLLGLGGGMLDVLVHVSPSSARFARAPG